MMTSVLFAFYLVFALQIHLSAESCSHRRRCPAIPVRPVCGTNLKTYNNICMLRRDKCSGKDVELAYRGVCKSCEEDISGVIRLAIKSFFKDKKRRKGSSRRGRISPCLKRDSRVTDTSSLMNCLQWKFHNSDTNADGVLGGRELYPTLRAVRRHYGDKRCLRKVIKFCDKNKDRKVTMNEWISCMRSSSVQLTKCQTMLEKAQKKISSGLGHEGGYVPKCTSKGTFASVQCHNLTGFCWCSTSDGRPIPGSSVQYKEPNCTATANASCFKSLVSALARIRQSRRGSYYVPRCFDDGTFKPIQCHIKAGYCWCVNKTGQKIPGTSRQMRYGKPNCKVTKIQRTYKGCTDSQKQEAIRKFLRHIEDEIKRGDSSSYLTQGIRFLESVTAITRRDRLLLWKFKKIDTNKDSVLTNRELEVIESKWKEITQDCSIAFAIECDKNKNGNITWTEWTNCLSSGGHSVQPTRKKPVLPPPRVGVCRPMRICLLSCRAGFQRDKYGCLVCKCREAEAKCIGKVCSLLWQQGTQNKTRTDS